MAFFATFVLSLAWLGLHDMTEEHLIRTPVLLLSLVLGAMLSAYVLRSFKWTAHQNILDMQRTSQSEAASRCCRALSCGREQEPGSSRI